MKSSNFSSAEKIWYGSKDQKSTLFNERVTLGGAALSQLKLNPDDICQIDADDNSIRLNGEIYRGSLKIALGLKRMGCSSGDVVGFVCRHSHDLTSAIIAALSLSTPTNCLDVSFTKHEIKHMFSTTKPKVIFCDDTVTETVKEVINDINSAAKLVVIGQKVGSLAHIDDLLKDEKDTDFKKVLDFPEGPEATGQECAAILCSSGTTGLSKGVSISHLTLHRLFRGSASVIQMDKMTNRIFAFSSMYWLSGYLMMFMSIFSGIPRVVTRKPFSPELLISILEKHKIGYLFTSPAQITQLLNSALMQKDTLDNVKIFSSGGSLISVDLANRIRSYLRNGMLTVGYGMTEIGIVSSQEISSTSAQGSVGVLTPGVAAKIVDEDGKQLGAGQSGEVCVKTRTEFIEYYNNPEATKNIRDSEGWIQTGDIGYFDEKNNLYITGRKKDMFKYSNYQITPAEIEEILEKHPEVQQAVVVGIPDPVHTDLPAAVVVRKDKSNVTERDLVTFVERQVADHKRLRGGVYFIEELPMTPSGKIKQLSVQKFAIQLYNKSKV